MLEKETWTETFLLRIDFESHPIHVEGLVYIYIYIYIQIAI